MMKIISPIIDFSFKKKSLSNTSSDNTEVLSTGLDPVEIRDFRVEMADPDDIYWVREICEATSLSAAARGSGISGRHPSLLEIKIKKREVVIAFAPDGRWAGFSFITS